MRLFPRRKSRIAVLASCLVLAMSAGATDAGPRAIGAGSFALSFKHASAWFAQQADSRQKILTAIVYFEGDAGWHNRRTDFRWDVNTNPAKIEMAVGTMQILVKYWSETAALEIQGSKFKLSASNVFLVESVDTSTPVVKALGIHDLKFGPDEVPAVALLRRNPQVWSAVSGESRTEHSKSSSVSVPEEVLAWDVEGLRLLATQNPAEEHKACELFRRAALRGYAGSQYRLGYCYETGRGVDQNFSNANEWYEKAAKQNFVDAQYKLGHSYRTGRGVPIDLAAALQWYKAAAQNGDNEAMHNIGWMYATGQGTKANTEEAYRWFLEAAIHGEVGSQFEIARRLREGDGVGKDLAASYAWLIVLEAQQEKCAPDDWQEVSKTIKSVEGQLDQAAIERAKQMAQSSLTALAKHEMEGFARD